MNKFTCSKGGGFLLALAASLSRSGGGGAGERLVPSEYATIQAAVNAAKRRHTARIAAGAYCEHVLINNKTGLGKTVSGEGL